MDSRAYLRSKRFFSLGIFFLASCAAVAKTRTNDGSALPYYDWGACPFECCTYRAWTTNGDVVLYDADFMDPEGEGKTPRWREASQPETEWWVKVETKSGAIGWSKEVEKFDHMDACE